MAVTFRGRGTLLLSNPRYNGGRVHPKTLSTRLLFLFLKFRHTTAFPRDEQGRRATLRTRRPEEALLESPGCDGPTGRPSRPACGRGESAPLPGLPAGKGSLPFGPSFVYVDGLSRPSPAPFSRVRRAASLCAETRSARDATPRYGVYSGIARGATDGRGRAAALYLQYRGSGQWAVAGGSGCRTGR